MPSETPSNIRKTIKKFIFPLSIGIISLSLGLWISQQILNKNNDSLAPKNLYATVLPNARPLTEFKLVDQNNQDFGVDQLRGQWSFLFFGFTNCPDVCPTTLKIMQSIWKSLPTKKGEKGHPKLYFISVDPERDKPETLKKYIQYFNPEFNAATGELDELDKLTNQIGIHYGYDEKEEGNDIEYIVNHSAHLILIDPKARMRAIISPPHVAKTIASNFQTIRLFYGD